MHEDPAGKLSAGTLQHRKGESRACSGTPKFSSHHRCCHGGRTISASWTHRNPEFPRGCSGVTSVSRGVSLVFFLVAHGVKHNLKSDWEEKQGNG